MEEGQYPFCARCGRVLMDALNLSFFVNVVRDSYNEGAAKSKLAKNLSNTQ